MDPPLRPAAVSTGRSSPHTFAEREVVEVLLALVAPDAVEVGLTLAHALVVAGDADGSVRVAVARCNTGTCWSVL